eukprot:4639646-Prymnesium_polylepis.2
MVVATTCHADHRSSGSKCSNGPLTWMDHSLDRSLRRHPGIYDAQYALDGFARRWTAILVEVEDESCG